MMEYPKFYDEVEHIVLQDDLSMFLGASEEGIIDISEGNCSNGRISSAQKTFSGSGGLVVRIKICKDY